eukprot:TRINITY_DN24645_c0_g1_i5.p1 TRINITY_DN24645_c0_g1~~TRINITY_DN24645_c0_g1_i5.p1  ORF type:complete len:131 (-),score=3.50 TRINITY_DN24645_c0_g1_i5:463-855(-)
MNNLTIIVLIAILGTRVSEACLCTDILPKSAPDVSCAEQAAFGNCDKDYLQGYCNLTCQRCGDNCKCDDVVPTNARFSCETLAIQGSCSQAWMQEGSFCAATCGYCTNKKVEIFGDGTEQSSPQISFSLN